MNTEQMSRIEFTDKNKAFIFRHCLNKESFRTKQKAIVNMNRLATYHQKTGINANKKLVVYKCKVCCEWHIGKKMES